MLVTGVGAECVCDNFERSVTVSAVVVTKIYLLTLSSGTKNQKISPISKFCHQNQKYHQIAADFKNETDQCQVESEECFKEKNLLENNLQQCSSEKHDSFQPADGDH